MSRSGYIEDCDGVALNLWRGAVNMAIRGKRGQAFLKEAIAVLDAMPEKRLIANSFAGDVAGEFCVLGAVGHARGMDLKPFENSLPQEIAMGFGVSRALVAEIMYENDEGGLDYWQRSCDVSLLSRWTRMRNWLQSNIEKAKL